MRIAAIDVGTNSIKMTVCRIRPDLSFEVLDREKDMIRLGAGSLGGRALAPSALAAAMQTLSKFHRLAQSHGVDEIIAAATSAVREADNGDDFIAQARQEFGFGIRVISGTEEARLIHTAATYAIGVDGRSAVIDVGGGSTEITLGTPRRVELGRSFKIGVIRLTERFATHDPLSGRDERRLVKHVRREADSHLRHVRKRGFQRVIGTSGTVLALGALALGAHEIPTEVRGQVVSARAIHRLRKRLAASTLEDRLKIDGLDPRRADIIVAGALLLDTLLDGLGADEVTLCDFGLREGLVLDYIQKNGAHIRSVERYPDARRRSVIELAERCNYRSDHAQQVASLAVSLFDGLREAHGLGDREREWLEYAALLHDVGLHISYERHHKHSYYLIKYGDLRGFDPREVEIIGLVARYHRQGTPKRSHEEFGALSRGARRTVRILAATLRLAEGLDRSHARAVSRLQVTADDEGWLVQVRAAGDAELELWAATRHASALAALLDADIRFELVRRAARARKDRTHAEHARPASRLPRQTVRRRGDRRLRQDHATRPPGQVAHGERAPGLRH